MDPDEQVSTPSGPPDIQTGDLDAVIAAAERGEYNEQASAELRGDTRADEAPDVADSSDGASAPAAQPEASPAPPAQQEPNEWERKYYSVSGNLNTVANQLREQQRQFALQQEQWQREREEIQRQQAEAQQVAQIRATLPQDEAEQAIQEYQQRTAQQREAQEYQQGAEAYRQFLIAENAKVEEAKLTVFRTALPGVMPDLARYVAQQIGAPEDDLVAMVATEEMQQVYGQVRDQRDLDLIAGALAGAARIHAKNDASRKQANGQQAKAAGVFRTEPEAGSRSGGISEVERIRAMDDKPGGDFDKLLAGLEAAANRR